MYIQNKRKAKKGFTLIELIVVIAIVTILAAALLPRLSGYIDESKKVEAINQARNVVNAYEILKVQNTTLSSNPSVLTLEALNSNLLTEDDTDKLNNNLTVNQCIGIVDGSESFTIDTDGVISITTPSTSTPTDSN